MLQPNYLADPMDRRVTLGGLRLIRRLLGTPELAAFAERETLPGPDVQSDDELLAFAYQNGSTLLPFDRHRPHGASDGPRPPWWMTGCTCTA